MLTIIADGFKSASARTLVKNAVLENKKCVLLVPEQETLSAEAEMALTLSPSFPLFLEVTNFSRLANTVFRKLGGVCYRYANDAAEALLMWKSLDALAPLLHVPRSDASAVEEMLSAIAELYASGVDEEALLHAAAKLPSGDRLKDKLEDLSLIFHTYRGEKSEIYGSHAEDLDRLALLLAEHKPFKDTVFFVDSFSSFTEQEYRILGALMRQTDVYVALSLKEGEHPSLCFEETKETKKRLSLLAPQEPMTVEGREDELPPVLLHAREHLFRADKALLPFAEKNEALSLWRAKNPFEAANAIAADIAARVRDGAHFGDFVIFVRDMKKYDGIIDEALSRQGIPYFSSATREVYSFSFVRMIRAAYDVLVRGYRTLDVIAFLKCGFGAFLSDDVDLFEIYANFWHISGRSFESPEPWTMSPAGYTSKLTESDKAVLERVNGVKTALQEVLSPLKESAADGATVKAHATALYSFLKHIGAERQLLSMAEKERALDHAAEADALERLFGLVLDMLDTACEAAGESELSREQFADMLGIMFSSVSFGQLPTSPDAVTVGSADLLRARGAKYAYLLGVNEGEFPATVSVGGAFAESERKMLEELGLPLTSDPIIRASHEEFCFLRALVSPTEHATVIAYDKTAAGGAAPVSALFERMEKMFGKAKRVEKIEAFTPEAALSLSLSDAEREALADILKEKEGYSRFLSGKETPIAETECYVDPSLVELIFPKAVRMSQSRFDDYRLCSFSYYCKHLLGLSGDTRAEFNALSIGSMIHAILERLFLTLKERGKSIKTVEREDIAPCVRELCEAYVKEVCPKQMLASPRLMHILSRLERSATLICEDVFDEFAQSEFEPSFFEFNIGRAGSPDPIAFALEDGAKMLFHGQIDRIDTYRHSNGQLYLRVVDYKTGTKSFCLDDVKRGKNLQMLLYLFSLWRSKNADFPKLLGLKEGEAVMPAGVSYMLASVKDVPLNAPQSESEVKAKAKALLERSGLTLADEEIVKALDKHLSDHYLPVKTDKDGNILWDKSFASLEELGALFDEMQAVVAEIGGNMRRGKACADPSDEKIGRDTVCASCSFKPICRRC